jgi:hypothetical protein
VRPSYNASRYQSRPDIQGIFHRTASFIAQYRPSRCIIIAQHHHRDVFSIARHHHCAALSIALHHPSHGIVIAPSPATNSAWQE